MFYRSTTTRRVLAACGVLLTLVSCARESHALCGLVSCRIAGDDVGEEAATKCCHKAKGAHICSMSRDLGSCPPYEPNLAEEPAPSCPAKCIYCSAPIPQQPSSPEDIDWATQPLASQGIAALAAVLLFDAMPMQLAPASGASSVRALDTCVRLCRFLA